MKPAVLTERLAAVAPPLLNAYFGRRNCCVAAARVVDLVCQRARIASSAVACEVFALPAAWHRAVAVKGGLEWLEDNDAAMRAIGEAFGPYVGCLRDYAPQSKGKSPLHVVSVVQGHLLDLTAGQFRRPERELELPSAVVAPVGRGWPASGADVQRIFPTRSGAACSITYRPVPGWRRYRRGADWREIQAGHPLVGKLANAVGLATSR